MKVTNERFHAEIDYTPFCFNSVPWTFVRGERKYKSRVTSKPRRKAAISDCSRLRAFSNQLYLHINLETREGGKMNFMIHIEY